MRARDLLYRCTRVPPRMEFVGGFWSTNAYCGFTLADTVAPRLLGETHTGVRRLRLHARRARPAGRLLILAAADGAHTVGPTLPPWLHVEPVGGRRLNARFGVLAFRDERRVLYRGIVTSADLTGDGLMRNREVAVVDDRRSPAGRALPYQLVTAFHALLDGLPAAQRAAMGAMLPDLHLPQPGLLREVVHTLDAPRDLLAEAFGGLRATRAVVVSPPADASDDPTPATALSAYLAPGAPVQLVTAHPPYGQRPTFPSAVLQAFEASGHRVDRMVVPTAAEDERGPVHRPLHATFIGLQDDQHARGLFGSTTFSATGLGLTERPHRELCVKLRVGDPAQIDHRLDALGAVPYRGGLRGPAAHRSAPDSPTTGDAGPRRPPQPAPSDD